MKMKTTGKVLAAAAFAALFFAFDAGVSQAASATANATGTVVAPMTLSNVVDLAFGSFVIDDDGNLSIEGSALGTVSADGGVHAMAGTRTPASVTIGGAPSSLYTVTVPTTVDLNGPSSSKITATLTKALATGTFTVNTAQIPAGGSDTLYIGGSLALTKGQTVGAYSGAITIDVNYQ